MKGWYVCVWGGKERNDVRSTGAAITSKGTTHLMLQPTHVFFKSFLHISGHVTLIITLIERLACNGNGVLHHTGVHVGELHHGRLLGRHCYPAAAVAVATASPLLLVVPQPAAAATSSALCQVMPANAALVAADASGRFPVGANAGGGSEREEEENGSRIQI